MPSDRLDAVRRRIRRLKTLPVLPTLLTAGNLACGLTAILCAAHYDPAQHPDMLRLGAVMIFVAMVCDMFDGKVARLTKTNGQFGAELDSLADVVSFGVAPALLVHRLILDQSGVFSHGERLLWFIAVFYAVMAAIRLARYNVEHTDEATPYFRGIPSPGAAAVLASWVIFDQEFWHSRLEGNYQTDGLFSCLDPFRWSLLAVTVVSALLMVSTVRYPHLGNLLLGRIGFRKAILIALLLIPFILWPPQAMLIGTTGYLLYGLAGESVAMWRRWRRGRNPIEDEDEDQAEDAGLSQDKDADIGPAPGR